MNKTDVIQHVFIIGAKSIGQYGGYETFVAKLISEHEKESEIVYHVACKANGDGSMDESKLTPISNVITDEKGHVKEFTYRNAHVFKIDCPDIGPAVAVLYDKKAIEYSIRYCKEHHIEKPIFYVLTCRIGLFINKMAKKIKSIGGKYYVNPDGHEWKRAKWPVPVRFYWKWSEKKMVKAADLVICDSLNIEKYICSEYETNKTKYIAYGADLNNSSLSDDDPNFHAWLNKWELDIGNYYLVVGRFVPENNYETMIREYMKCSSTKTFVLISNINEKFLQELEKKLGFKSDKRIRFVGTVYDKELLKKIRECAYGYLHGHEVGGTNPSLLEALASTKLNLLLDVGFNREVAGEAALYWNKDIGNLAYQINCADKMTAESIMDYGKKAKARIQEAYSWPYIANEYKKLWGI